MSTAVLPPTELGQETVDEPEAPQWRAHIFCLCRPRVSFCGAYLPPGPCSAEMPDGDECPPCYQVWQGGHCWHCGLRWCEADYPRAGM